MSWLTKDLQEEIKNVFQPKYDKELSEDEIIGIANSLTESLEAIFKFRLRTEYGKI